MAITYLDVAGTYSGPGAFSYTANSYPGGAIVFVNSATGKDDRGRIKFSGTSQSGVSPQGSPGPTGDPTFPMASVFGPNGALSVCSANRGDVIIVAPGHTENLATGAVINIPAGVTITGGGYGNARPTFTFTVLGTTIAGLGSFQLNNLLFNLTGVASLVSGFTLNQSGAQFINCRFLQATSTNQAAAAVTLNTGADDAVFYNCDFDAMQASGAVNAVTNPAANNINRLQVINSWFHGNWSNACVNIAATGSVEFLIDQALIKNINAAGFCLVFAAGNTITGEVAYSNLYTFAATTAGFLSGGGGTGIVYTQVFGSDQNATMTGTKNSALFPAAGTN